MTPGAGGLPARRAGHASCRRARSVTTPSRRPPPSDRPSESRPPGAPAVVPGDLDSGLVGLLIVGRLLGVSADGDRLRREFGRTDRTFGDIELLRAARALGLKARCVRSR